METVMQLFSTFFIPSLLVFACFGSAVGIAKAGPWQTLPAKIICSAFCAAPLAVFVALFSIIVFFVPYFIPDRHWVPYAGCAMVLAVCWISIWKPFGVRARKIIALCITGMCVLFFVGVPLFRYFQGAVVSDWEEAVLWEEIDLYQYQPFLPDTNAKSLDVPSDLRFDGNTPRLDGATALYPLYASFVRATYPEDANIYGLNDAEVICSRTGKAFENLLDGRADMIFLMGISEDQAAAAQNRGIELKITPIGREAFVFFVHRANTVSDLSVDGIRSIYTGETTNWREVGGSNDAIRAYQRPPNSGSQTMLEEIMNGLPLADAPTENIYSTMGGMYQAVAHYQNHKNALGYSFRFYINDMIDEDNVKLLSIDGVAPTALSIADKTYPFAHDFYAVTVAKGAPDGNERQRERMENTEALLAWILSPQGQGLLEKTGYVRLSPD